MYLQKTTLRHWLFLAATLFTLFMLTLTGCANSQVGSSSQSGGATTSATSARGSISVLTQAAALVLPVSTRTAKPTVPFKLMRMLDQQHGWALTASSILKTSDGGQTWQDVTPPHIALSPNPSAVFYNRSTAWVDITKPFESGIKAIQLIHTTNGGKTWTTQSATINTQPMGLIDLKFINAQEGWMEVDEGIGAGQQGAGIVHTTNGGATWKLISTSITPPHGVVFFPYMGRKTGLTFINSHTGWAGVTTYGNAAFVFVTQDGGVSWIQQTLPTLQNMGGSTPPVVFGHTIIMPMVEYNGFTFDVSHNGGFTWQSTFLLPTNISQNSVYVADSTHAWAINNLGGLYFTTTGGQSWGSHLTLHNVSQFSFISNRIGWAYSGPSQNVPTLLKTTDGGHSWNKISYKIY